MCLIIIRACCMHVVHLVITFNLIGKFRHQTIKCTHDMWITRALTYCVSKPRKIITCKQFLLHVTSAGIQYFSSDAILFYTNSISWLQYVAIQEKKNLFSRRVCSWLLTNKIEECSEQAVRDFRLQSVLLELCVSFQSEILLSISLCFYSQINLRLLFISKYHNHDIFQL